MQMNVGKGHCQLKEEFIQDGFQRVHYELIEIITAVGLIRV